MEKDLRDAFKALSLVRADLVATRKAKADVEDQWRAFAAQQRDKEAQRGAQVAQLHETLRMREEDLRTQLMQAQAQTPAQAAAGPHHTKESLSAGKASDKHEKASICTESEDGEPEGEDNQREEAASTRIKGACACGTGTHAEDDQKMVDVAKDHMALLTSVYALKTQLQEQAEQLVAQDACFKHERSEWSLLSEAMKQQITDLKESKLDLVREKKFMDEKFEFQQTEVDVVKSERDALQAQLRQLEQRTVAAAVGSVDEAVDRDETLAGPDSHLDLQEKLQLLEAKMRSLEKQHTSQIQSVTQDSECLQRELDVQMSTVDALSTDLEAATAMAKKLEDENQTLQSHYENERTVLEATWADEQLTLTQRMEESITVAVEKGARVEELEHELGVLRKELQGKQQELDGLAQDRTNLIQQLQDISEHSKEQLRVHTKEEEERMKTQLSETEKLQHELTTLLANFEAATSENAVKMSSLERTNDALQRSLVEKTRAVTAAEVRERGARDQVQRLQQIAAASLTELREQLVQVRALVVEQQQQHVSELERMRDTVEARVGEELSRTSEQFKTVASELERKFVASEEERSKVESELQIAQDAARTLLQQLETATAHNESHQKTFEEVEALRSLVESKEREISSLSSSHESEVETLRLTHADQLAALKSVHGNALHDATVEQNALANEVQELKLVHHRLESDLALARKALETAEQRLQQVDESTHCAKRLEQKLSGLEQQLMAAEDRDRQRGVAASLPSWAAMVPQIRGLDDFLAQLQLFAGRLQTSLHLCAENARAMHVLSCSSSASPTLLADLAELVRLAVHWKQLFDVKGLGLHVRLVRRSVLATLAQWFEEGAAPGDAPPPLPPFGIESEEVAHILHNWTQDTEKKRRAAHWLKRIVSGGGGGGSSSSDGDQSSDVPRDDQAGSTLELNDMTREVKDAFTMLIVPLLKQNASAFVRVFTRRVCDIKSSFSPDERCWEMRIHVQLARRQAPPLRRPESFLSPAPSLRRLSSASSVSSAGSASSSSAASSLSLSSISSTSKLQIIQARLQQMQQQQTP